MKYIKLILPLLVLSSCSQLLLQKALFGIRNPKFINKNELVDFLQKHDLSLNQHYGLTSKSFKEKIDTSKYSNPFVYSKLYNKKGNRVLLDSASRFCYGNLRTTLENLKDTTFFSVKESENINTNKFLKEGLADLNGQKTKLPNTELFDYILVIYWSTFVGKHSVNELTLENHVLKNKPGLDILVLKINMDFRDYMKEEKIVTELPKFRRKKGEIKLE